MGDIIMLRQRIIKGELKKNMYQEIIMQLENNRRINGKHPQKNIDGDLYLYDFDDVEKVVDDILEATTYYQYTGATPIVKISKAFGFEVYSEELDKEKPGDILVGEAVREEYQTDKVILVDDEEPLSQQRFVAAHELAHYLFDYLGDDTYKNRLFSDQYLKDHHDSPQEKIANRFAAAILMPKKLFIKQYKYAMSCENNLNFIRMYLSEYFETTEDSIEKRMLEVF